MKINIDDVIGMAWSDRISFEEIKKKSYVLWRKRVRGRISKHRRKTKNKLNNYEF